MARSPGPLLLPPESGENKALPMPKRHAPRPSHAARWLLSVVLLAGLAVSVASAWVGLRYRDRILPAREVPEAPVALVFGAGLSSPGVPSPVLAARMEAAIALYREGKVSQLLLSGDNQSRYHDETGAMQRYALAQGVQPDHIRLDRLGLSTYDSVRRAQVLYGVKRALLVTQRFHLPRALYLANGLGIEAWGVAADAEPDKPSPYAWRELAGRPLALAQVLTRPPFAGEVTKARSAPAAETKGEAQRR